MFRKVIEGLECHSRRVTLYAVGRGAGRDFG